MDWHKAKLLFMMLPFLVLIVVGAIFILLASSTFYVEGEGRVFYNPLGVPGILAILVGLIGLVFLWLTKQ